MDICATAGHTPDHEPRAREREAHQRGLRVDLTATRAGPHRGMSPQTTITAQAETSDNQLIARWRSRARSPMSMPVVVAT